MQINSVQDDFDGMAATSNPLPPPVESTSTTASAPAPKAEASAPKTSTIKIQDPPEKETQKDDSITVALRQAGEEAAAKAKETSSTTKSTAPAAAAAEPQSSKPDADAEPKEGDGEHTVRRKSVAPEIAETGSKRPPLVPEIAAVSSANFRADNAEALGLINHHRNSNIAAESKEEAENLAKDLRKSISGDQHGVLESLREQRAALPVADATVEDALEG